MNGLLWFEEMGLGGSIVRSANTYLKGSQEEDKTLGVLKGVLDGVSRGLWK
jgi:hypothetical protein